MENYKIIAVGLILVVMVTNISVIYSNEVDNLELAESAPGFQQGFGGYVRQRMLASRKSGLRLCLQERRMRKLTPICSELLCSVGMQSYCNYVVMPYTVWRQVDQCHRQKTFFHLNYFSAIFVDSFILYNVKFRKNNFPKINFLTTLCINDNRLNLTNYHNLTCTKHLNCKNKIDQFYWKKWLLNLINDNSH